MDIEPDDCTDSPMKKNEIGKKLGLHARLTPKQELMELDENSGFRSINKCDKNIFITINNPQFNHN